MKKEMNSNNFSCMRGPGQRSIPSTFINRSSTDHQPSNCKEKLDSGRSGNKLSKISLSDFLNRKLQKTSEPFKSVQGKEIPFFTPGTSVGANQCVLETNPNKKIGEAELNVPDLVFEQFKHKTDNQHHICLNREDEAEKGASMQDTKEGYGIQDVRKKRNEIREGAHSIPPAPKGLVVLGDDPRPKRMKYQKSFIGNKKHLPLYNHYASGSGWWDSDMEGVDNDEVGFNEVWEGVGSTTLGGLDWH